MITVSGIIKERDDTRILSDGDLPGPLSIGALGGMGMFAPLTCTDGYLPGKAADARTRAGIIAPELPCDMVACLWLAAWVWAGGPFPGTIDIVSTTHYRAPQLSRTVRVYNRVLARGHATRLAGLFLTTPARTVCDLACLGSVDGTRRAVTVRRVMAAGSTTPDECMDVLRGNPRWTGYSHGMRLLQSLKEDAA